MHRHHNSKHLRQRHGSDTLRLQPFERDNESPHQTPYLEEDEESMFFTDASGADTPRTLEAGNLQLQQEAQFQDAPLKSQTLRPDPSRLVLPPRKSSLAPSISSNHLPEGARTPTQDSALRVVTYPPVAPTWLNMPNKWQLAILALSRFVDFFQMAALQTYMVHQLKSFDTNLPDSVISHQAGLLQGAFTAAQIVTSILWGRAADKPGVGRKLVLNIGLVGTGIGCIGVGFSTSFHQACAWRVMSGAINGTVGAARTMVAESVDKRWHPRAFLLLPAAFNVANVLGPILSGLLTDPVTAYPQLFGPNSTFGGASGVSWMSSHPYALANLLPTTLLFAEAFLCHCYLHETLKGFAGVDIGIFDPIRLFKVLVSSVRDFTRSGYKRVATNDFGLARRGLLSDDSRDGSIELERLTQNFKSEIERPAQRLPFRAIWTSNVCWTLVSVAVFDFHMGAFSTLWILFLSAAREYSPVQSDSSPKAVLARSAFKFTGGLAFPPHTIGFAMAIIGFIGIVLQFLLYPYANGRFGLMRCFRSSLFLFPIAYFLAPYISLLPSTTHSPEPSSGLIVWLGIAFVVLLQVAARTFALPASIILLNNSSPHPSVLATIHGLGQADSATFRTIGPIISSYWFGTWLERGVVGMAWWYVAFISAFGAAAAFKVRNGSGHEIFLPGEEEKMEESDAPGQAGGPSGSGGGGR